MLFLGADFHQGSDRFSPSSRGRQCVPNCLVYHALLKIKPLSEWSNEYLNFVLQSGDEMYRYLKSYNKIQYDYLAVTELPQYFIMLGKQFALKSNGRKDFCGTLKKELYYDHDLSMSLEFAFNLIFSSGKSKLVAILIFCQSAIAIIKQQCDYYIFDPHSRSDNGLLFENGFAQISKHGSLESLCNFIRDLGSSLTNSPVGRILYDMHAFELQVMNRCVPMENICKLETSFLKSNSYKTNKSFTLSQGLKRKHSDKSCSLPVQQKKKCYDQKANDDLVSKLIKKFNQSVSHGPIYVCTCCSQTWFKENVVRLSSVKYNAKLFEKCSWNIKSVNNIEWMCQTCRRYIEAGKLPECSKGNDMKFPAIPEELMGLSQLEQRLISPRLPFMTIRQQPRGGQLSMKGNVVNVPADVNKTVRVLPRTLTNDETVFVKLKRKISYRHSIAQEMIRPNRVLDAVKLLSKTKLFKSEGISVDLNWTFQYQPDLENSLSEELAEDDSWTEDTNFDNRPSGNLDTVLHPVGFREFNRVLNLAPGEGNCPLGLFQDFNSEFLSFPAIYCGQTRTPNNERLVPIHFSTIAKWELRNVDRRVAMSVPNLFFKMKKLQIKYIQDKILIALRKCKSQGKKMTVGDVLAPNAFDNIVKHNEGYQILKTLRGSPSYWESAKKDLFAMIRQLGIPTWFCSLSAAETKWPFLIKALGKLVDKKDYSEADIEQMSWHEICRLISSDPVTCARYFQYCVQIFLNDILFGPVKPLGTINDFFYRVEFQQRGSPHIHMVVWIKDAPDVVSSTPDMIADFVNKHITCKKDETIKDLINYQTHRHARTCRKKGKSVCRFDFPLPPMPNTLVLSPIDPESESVNIKTCKKHYDKIANKLDEMKYGCDMSFNEFLSDLQLTENEYYDAIRSSLQRKKVFLQRLTSEIRINCYNSVMLKCWQANIDVQLILDPFSCASYIVSYISKGQRGMSNLMYNAVQEAKEHNLNLRQQLRHVGNKFLTHIEVGAQEAVYLVLQMPLRRSSRSVLFINTSPPGERLTILKSVPMLEEMPKESTDIESDNVIKRYSRRPKDLNSLCLADFASWFDVSYPPGKPKKVTDTTELPELEDDDNLEDDPHVPETEGYTVNSKVCEFNKEYILNGGGILKKRKSQKVLRYVRYNIDQDPENYYRELIFLFHPWRNEEHDIPTGFNMLKALYNKSKVLIEGKRTEFENKRKLLDMIINYHENDDDEYNTGPSFMPSTEHLEEQDRTTGPSLSDRYGCFEPGKPVSSDVSLDIGITRKQITDDECVHKLPDGEYRQLVRSLNKDQKEFFYHILHWYKTRNEPLYNFLSGGAGVGKSVVTRAVYQSLIRCLNAKPGSNPDDIKVLLCAPTGKAAHNINGNTIHSSFCIPASMGFNYKPLAMEQLNVYRVKYHHLKVVLIDEISMVGSKMFNFINCRLQEIMGNQQIFGAVSIIAVGDLYQLKPVMDSWIFSHCSNEYGAISANLWQDNFKLFELKKIMRQKDDLKFAELLNRLREGHHTQKDVSILKSRVVDSDDTDLQSFPHLYTTCMEVDNFNERVFSLCKGKSDTIKSIDLVTGDLHENLHANILEKIPSNPSKTMGLYGHLKLAEGLHAEISINISIEDGLTNGAACKIMYLDYRVFNSDRCSIVWVLFDDQNIGKAQRCSYKHLLKSGIQQIWTPIFEVSRKFHLNNNQSYQITRRQFPLRLSAAKTIHKSQGSSLNNEVVHFGTRKNNHMHYVGLSRVRTLSGLYILELSESKISVSQDVVIEMERMRLESYLTTCLHDVPDENDFLNIIFHNSRSLHLHIADLKCEAYLQRVDVVGIVESRLMASDKNEDFYIENFDLVRNDAASYGGKRPYHGTVVYSKIQFSRVYSGNVQGIETTIVRISKNGNAFVLMVIYCPPKTATVHNFKLLLKNIASFVCPHQTVIMGDFNIDASEDCSLGDLMLQYNFKQLVTGFTTDYGSTLDHIYSNFEKSNFVSGVLESYYSDHKPVFICIPVS